MEWNEKLQQIIDLTEQHLQRKEEPVDIQEITRIAGCSYGFFQKVFSYMNGISYAEYVRSRKLTLAGYDLKSSDIKIVDLSYKYGYDSPTSFTKAFRLFHGVSPKEARSTDVELRVVPKMQIADSPSYSWRIERKPTLRLIGKSIKVSCQNNLHFTKIPEFWNDCQRNGIFSYLASMDTRSPGGLFGLFSDYDAASEVITYSIMVCSDYPVPDGMQELTLPANSWAVFDCRGAVPWAIQNGWKYLNEEWLLKYPFRHAPCPEVEWYSAGNSYDKNYLSQIWIPIIEEE